MQVQQVFGDFPLAKFVGEYLYHLPFALAGSAAAACPLGSWATVEAALSTGDANLLAVRGGEQYGGAPLTTLADAQRLNEEGYTISIRHAERYCPDLRELAESFAATFCGPVDVQMFATPGGGKGFSWHYDAEDVFILQTAGEKTYSLRKNTGNPWPLLETLPADMQYEREIMPLMRVSLRAGDLLYIPCGYWHATEAAAGEAAISLALGVMSPSAIDVYDYLRRTLIDSLRWRQRLPLASTASPLRGEALVDAYRELFSELGKDLAKLLIEERTVREFLHRAASKASLP